MVVYKLRMRIGGGEVEWVSRVEVREGGRAEFLITDDVGTRILNWMY